MLIGNYTVFQKTPGRFFGGSTTSAEVQVRSAFNKSGASRNWMYRSDETTARKTIAVPTGYAPGGAWNIPQVAGEISSTTLVRGVGSQVASGAMGLNAQGALSGAGDIIPPFGQLVVSAVANLTGSGAITNAAGQAFLNAVASLSGSGGVSAATLGALGWITAPVSGSGSAAGTATALGTLAAAITVTGATLTTGNVGAAVWQYLIEAGYTGEQIMRLLAAHAAGDATSLEGATPAFKSLDGTKTRIGGTYTAGTRTVTTRDGS